MLNGSKKKKSKRLTVEGESKVGVCGGEQYVSVKLSENGHFLKGNILSHFTSILPSFHS